MTAAIANAHIRIARPTNSIAAIKQFYQEGLDFQILYEFKDHDGFDGIMLGLKSHPYHLEFTTKTGHDSGRAPSQDNLLVFYLPDSEIFAAAVSRMESAGHQPVPSFNPYWDVRGKTYEDHDGYRVVLVNAAWESN